MRFPTGSDPYFTDVTTLADVYHFGTQHFDHHLAQLTVDDESAGRSPRRSHRPWLGLGYAPPTEHQGDQVSLRPAG
jgi:hypothetical protein